MKPYRLNVNIIPWWEGDDLAQHHDQKYYAFGKDYALICELNYFLPFQLTVDNSTQVDADVDGFYLVDNSGNQIDVTIEMKGAGLQYDKSPTGYDLIIFPSTVPMATNLSQGRYYAIMTTSDGRQWYSEKFRMTDYVDDLIRVEYWHNSDFEFGGGKIKYFAPYKNYFYINAALGKPRYENENRVDRKEGVNQHLQQTSWKVYRFELFAPEYLVDAIRLIWQHDNAVVKYNDIEYSCDEFLVLQPNWQEQGDIAAVTCEFTTDKVTITNARAYETVEYEPAAGTCIPSDYVAQKLLSDNTSDYTNGTGLSDSNYVIVLENATGNYILQQFSGGGYTTISQADFEVVYNQDTDKYWFKHSGTLNNKPIITEVLTSPLRVKGYTFPGTSIQVWTMVYSRPPNRKSGYGTAAQFQTTGIEFDDVETDSRNRLYVQAVTWKCDNVAENSEIANYDPAPTWIDPDAQGWQWNF